MAKKKPAGKKPISDAERARRQAAAAAALGNDNTAPQKSAGHDHHSTVAKPRIIRHQGR
jgi:hypothetical protein